jgi:hypothetical protein
MGRESANSGQEIAREAAMNSKREYTPKEFIMGDRPFPEIPVPRNQRFCQPVWITAGRPEGRGEQV